MYVDYVCGKTRTGHSIWYSSRSKIAFLVLPREVTVFSRFSSVPKDITGLDIDLHDSYLGISTEEGVLHRDKSIWYLDGSPCVPSLITSIFPPDAIPLSVWNDSLVKCGKFRGEPIYFNPINNTFWVKHEGTFYRRLILHRSYEGVEDDGSVLASSYVCTNTEGVISLNGVKFGGYSNIMDVNAHLPVVLKRYAEKGVI